MNFFDLHCDTIGECANRNLPLRENALHISLEKGAYLNSWIQVFAIWMPDEKRGKEAANYFDRVYDYYLKELSKNEDVILPCFTSDDIIKAENENKAASILAVEGGSVLCGDIDRISLLKDRGVKILTLTWNGANELGSGCMESEDKGLTSFGKSAVKELCSAGIVPDVSHLSEKGFYDTAQEVDFPFIASHSDCNRVHRHKRNLTDEQIDEIIRRKGLIGVNFYKNFLSDNPESGFDGVLRHLYHILERGGENVAAMGSDFDGCEIADELAGIEKIPYLWDYLNKNGIPEDTLNSCFYGNARNFFFNVLHR